MGNKIFQLPDSIANQIKAGEVVIRPASVVKELMENAIDAGAKHITVNFRNGGIGFIQVIDDGCGMNPDDAVRAFDRHATSKIKSAEDLYSLRTFGFRGEALASIAAVAEVELKTASAECECATAVTIHGGELISVESTVHSVGSQFVVKNLFYNTPARRKFLKSEKNEGDHIIREFQKIALCNPEIEFTLYQNDALKYSLPPTNLRQRIVQAMGNAMRRILMDLNVETSIVKIHGFVCSPKKAKKENNDQYMFINGRYFRSPYLHKAITKAYENIINAQLSPGYFIYMEIDPARIDVNVHPQKTEVKFEDESAVWQILNAAVRESLAKMGGIGMMDLDIEDPIDIPVYDPNNNSQVNEPLDFLNPDFNPFAEEPSEKQSVSRVQSSHSHYSFSTKQRADNWEQLYADFESGSDTTLYTQEEIQQQDIWSQIEIEEAQITTQQELALEKEEESIPYLRVGNNYAAVSTNEGLTIIDLKRAYQLIVFEHILNSMGNGVATIQRQILTEPIQLTANEYDSLMNMKEQLVDAGFEIEFEEDHYISIHGVPAYLEHNQTKEVLSEMLADSESFEMTSQTKRQQLIAKTISKNAAKNRAGFTTADIQNIISEILTTDNNCYTPDGLLTMWQIRENEIIKQFKK